MFIVYSTGTGRTGTYIAFDALSDEICVNENINVMGKVLEMRACGKDMVENLVRQKLLCKIITYCFWIIYCMHKNKSKELPIKPNLM